MKEILDAWKRVDRDMVAAAMSIIPGLGHLYKHHYLAGFGILTLGNVLVAFVAGLMAFATLGLSLIVVPAAWFACIACSAYMASDEHGHHPWLHVWEYHRAGLNPHFPALRSDPMAPSGAFPERPETMGAVTAVPPATLQGLADIAGCASTDTTRQILNGVLFTPEDGGRLVATDGKRLACCPASVPSQSFVLPSGACHILGHPDFTSDLATITWIDNKDEEKRRVAIKCGRHQLVSNPLVGNYPNYKVAIPSSANQMAVIPHDRKPGLIAWLRSLGKDQSSVRLDWQKRGQLTLSHRDTNGHSATMQVPVEIHGNPPVIAFNARYLADALEIGSTLCLSDELGPGICRHPTGRFSVIMPMRVNIPAGTNAVATDTPPQQHQAAA